MIIGHKKQRRLIKKMISSGKIPHALLFSGSAKLGKKTVALKFISDVFGQKLSNHPDFIFIEPEGKYSQSEPNSVQNTFAPSSTSGRGKIHIKQIRELNWRLSLKPSRAPILGAIIDQAHLMTREAQHAFLKTLEEPKGKSLIILVTAYSQLLLPTILSRCEIIKFYPVEKSKISDFLAEKGLSGPKIEEISDASLGKPGVALDFLADPQKLKEHKQRKKDLVRALNSPLFVRFQYAEQLAKNENLKDVLAVWLAYFRKKLFSAEGQSYLKKVPRILSLIEETIFLISTTNVNPRLALEVLMLEL